MNRRMTVDERLARNSVPAPNDCLIWTGAVNTQGYGIITVNGRTWRAHRLSYTLRHGDIPTGLVLDHFVCDIPACINPDHLRPVTQRENILRGNGTAAGHAAQTHCKCGHLLHGEIGQRRCAECRPYRPGKPRVARQKAPAPPAQHAVAGPRVPSTLRDGLAALLASRDACKAEAAATSQVADPQSSRHSMTGQEAGG